MQSNQETDLRGKVAVITGAARNMGRAFAQALARKGADVVIHYHSDSSLADAEQTARLVKEAGGRALLIKGDLSIASQADMLFEQTLQAFGRVDILINNAGKVIKKAFVDYTEEDFEASFKTNTKTAFLMLQRAARHIQDNGRIINMGTSLLDAFTGHYGLYAGSKAPLEDFTRALAKEIGGRGITVNTLAPGPVDTAFFHGQEDDKSTAYLSAATPMGRLGQIEDIVPLVEFIASPASQWITGQTLFVNGGFVTR